MKPLLPVLFAVAMASSVAAQHSLTLVVSDRESGGQIVGVHIRSSDGMVLSTTNHQGVARFPVAKGLKEVTLTHIGFNDTTLQIHSTQQRIDVLMSPRMNQLKPVSVTALPTPLLADKPWYVTSYVHCRAGLLLFAAPRRMLSQRSLSLVNEKGDVMATLPWSHEGTLMLDAAGDVWFIGRKTAMLLDVSPKSIAATDLNIPIAEFDAGIARIELKHGDRYFFRHLTFDNQKADFYVYDHRAKICDAFCTIADEKGMKLRETRDIFETNEFERRFGEMCFFRPVLAHLLVKDSNLLLVDYSGGEILYFDSSLTLSAKVPIAYHQDKSFERTFIYDKVLQKYYALFEKNGVLAMREVDLATGQPGIEITLPDFPFTEEITVHNGNLWFLYCDTNEQSYKRIYKLPLVN